MIILRSRLKIVQLAGDILFPLFRDPRTADIIVTSICVMVTFYAACRLYELASVENVSIHIGIVKSIRYFVFSYWHMLITCFMAKQKHVLKMY